VRVIFCIQCSLVWRLRSCVIPFTLLLLGEWINWSFSHAGWSLSRGAEARGIRAVSHSSMFRLAAFCMRLSLRSVSRCQRVITFTLLMLGEWINWSFSHAGWSLSRGAEARGIRAVSHSSMFRLAAFCMRLSLRSVSRCQWCQAEIGLSLVSVTCEDHFRKIPGW
jgi:hypothetical protein